MYLQTYFGRKSTAVARVTVHAKDEPKVAAHTPVVFNGLRVEVRTNKAGGWVETWMANEMIDPVKNQDGAKPATRPSNEKAA